MKSSQHQKTFDGSHDDVFHDIPVDDIDLLNLEWLWDKVQRKHLQNFQELESFGFKKLIGSNRYQTSLCPVQACQLSHGMAWLYMLAVYCMLRLYASKSWGILILKYISRERQESITDGFLSPSGCGEGC